MSSEYEGVPADVAATCEVLCRMWSQWTSLHPYYTGRGSRVSAQGRELLLRIHERLAPYGQFAASCKAHDVDPRRIRNWILYQAHPRRIPADQKIDRLRANWEKRQAQANEHTDATLLSYAC